MEQGSLHRDSGMSDHQTTEVVLVHLEYIRAKQDEIVSRLDVQNGRLGKMENRATALETRADESRISGAKWGAGLGALIAAMIAGLAQAFGGGK